MAKAARARFVAQWDSAWQAQYKIPKGFLLLRMQDRFRLTQGKAFKILDEKQRERLAAGITDHLVDLEVTVDAFFDKRTLDQNNLMWALYEVEANEAKDPSVTAESLYDEDMRTLAPVETLAIVAGALSLEELDKLLKRMEIKPRSVVPRAGGVVEIQAIRSSSKWNTREMHEHIESLFRRLAYKGVEIRTSADLGRYWLQWQDYKNAKKIVLNDEPMTAAEYKAKNPSCEACGVFIGPDQGHPSGSGELHHISSRGSGMTSEEEKGRPSDWLHLCVVNGCHALWNEPKGGAEAFVKKFPHLTYKVHTAMKREHRDEVQQGKLDLEPKKEKALRDYDDDPRHPIV